MKPLELILEAAKQIPQRIVLSEGDDPRIVAAAIRAANDGIAEIILIGNRPSIMAELTKTGAEASRFRIEDPQNSALTSHFAKIYHDLRKAKGVDAHKAAEAVRQPLVFAAMMVREGEADGTVGGAVATTADTVRAALQVIGKAQYAKIVSSFFLMMLCQPHHVKKGAFVFADCGLIIDPDAEELAEIAVMSASSFSVLTKMTARVAMLSFSTGGSATHERATKVVKATSLARAAAPDLMIDGELQFDAAFVETVSAAKAPNSPLEGQANVFIFPNLDAANIGLKLAQRIGGAEAIGPILQGLAKPANDLSRGCTIDDIYHMIAVTAVQAASSEDRSVRLA